MNRKIITLAAVGLALLSANVASARCCPTKREPTCPSKCQRERPACPSKCKQERPACKSECRPEKSSCCPFDVSGWYVRGSGSLDWHRDFTLKNTTPTTEDLEFKTGWNVAGSIGAIIDQWRLEVEATYRTNDLDSVKNSGNSTTYHPNGDVSHFALMLNVFYDIPIHDCFSIYLGGGLGVDFFSLDINTYTAASQFNKVDDNGTLFAWQLMGGVSYDLTDQVALFLGYRFFATTEPDDFNRTVGGTSLKTSYEDFLYSHSVEGGIRFTF